MPSTDAPNLRLNAARLGVRLLIAAANPFSGLTRQASRKAAWQPEHPFGLPRWWPLRPGSGRLVGLDQIELMRSALRSEDLCPKKPDLAADQNGDETIGLGPI